MTAAAEAAGVTERTVYRWLARFREQGSAGLLDRSSAPRRIPRKTSAARVAAICELRRLRLTAVEIAERVQMPISTVSAGAGPRRSRQALRLRAARARQSLRALSARRTSSTSTSSASAASSAAPANASPAPSARVTDRATDAAGVRRGVVGWESVHVAIDDHSRLAYAEVLPDERASTAIAFLQRAIAFYATHAINVQRVMTDNGSAYRSHAHHRDACQALGIRHLRTRPYRPRTNGKAERLIQTLLRRWAYHRTYQSSAERTAALGTWLDHYNYVRPHGSIGKRPPGSRLTNAPGNNT